MIRTLLAASCSAFLLSPNPALAQEPELGYGRTYVIHADGAWVAPGLHIEPAFVKVASGRIVWVSTTDDRRERTSMLGKTSKDPLIRVQGTLAPTMVDAWTNLAPSGLLQSRKQGPTHRLEDAMPLQVANEDEALAAQVLAARQAGVGAVYMAAGRNGIRRGVGQAAEFTALDLPLLAGPETLDFAVGVHSGGAMNASFMMEDLEKAFEEASGWRTSWDDFDEAMEKYEENLKKYEEKFQKYLDEKKEAEAEEAAQAGEDKKREDGPKAPKRPKKPMKPQGNAARDLLLGAMDGSYRVRVVADSSADIRSLILLKETYGLDLVLVSGNEADLLADELRLAEIPVVLPLVGDYHAAPDAERSLASRFQTLVEADVEVALASGGSEGQQMLMAARAGELVAAGCAEADVWDALTIAPARILGLSNYGTLHSSGSATMLLFEGRSPFDASAPIKAHKPK